jgi:hypothetical protein
MTKPTNTTITSTIAEKFLAVLGDGTPPFIDIAADRCGLSREVVRVWFLPRPETGRSPSLDKFLTRVRQIRGEYIAKAARMIADPQTPEEAKRANDLKWILKRLDRESFEEKAPQLGEAELARGRAGRAGPALPADHPDVLTSVEDLATPETMQ